MGLLDDIGDAVGDAVDSITGGDSNDSTDAGSGVTGDSGSDTSYGGGGSDTTAGSGSTGDDSDNDFGGGWGGGWSGDTDYGDDDYGSGGTDTSGTSDAGGSSDSGGTSSGGTSGSGGSSGRSDDDDDDWSRGGGDARLGTVADQQDSGPSGDSSGGDSGGFFDDVGNAVDEGLGGVDEAVGGAVDDVTGGSDSKDSGTSGGGGPSGGSTGDGGPGGDSASDSGDSSGDFVDDVRGWADRSLGSTDEMVAREVQKANADGMASRVGSMAEGAGDMAGTAQRAYDDMARFAEGAARDLQSGLDQGLGGLDETAGQVVEGAGEAVDTAHDISSKGHKGDEVSSTELYRKSGLNTAVDAAFQRPEEIERALGIPADKRDDTVQFSGPGFKSTSAEGEGVFRSGKSGELDKEVTRSLTEGSGPLSEEQRRELRRDIEQRKEFFGVGREADQFVTDVTGSEKAGNFARGVGDFPGEAAGATAQLTLAADTTIQVGQNLPETVQEYGAGTTAYNIMEVGGRATKATVKQAEENPYQFAGSFVSGLVGGTAAGKAIQAGPNVARGASIRARGGEIYDYEDLSDPPTRTEGMGLPGYTERAQADPEYAREEFVEQARKNELAGEDPVAFHGRSKEAVREHGGFGKEFEAPEGGSEIPGLFQSADLSHLRLSGSPGSGISLPRVGLPRPATGGSRVLAERDVDVDVMPSPEEIASREGLDLSDFAEHEDAGLMTNRMFMFREPDRSKSFIRTDEGGGPTPEQEVIAPPGSKFVEDEGIFGVRMGGYDIPFTDRRIGGAISTGRLMRRADAEEDVDASDTMSQREVAEETSRAVSESYARYADDRVPFAPVGGYSGPPAGSQGGSAGPQGSDPYGTGAVQDDLRDLYGDNRVTRDDRGPSSRGDNRRDRGRRSRPSDGRDTSRNRDSSRTSGDYRGPTDSGGRVTGGGPRITEPTPSGGSGGSSGGRSGGGSSGGGSSGGGSGGGGSGGGNPPSSETPPPSRGPPSTGPPSISEYITPPPSYNPPPPPTPTYGYPRTPTIPEITPRTERRGDEEEEKQPFAIPFGFWDRSWVNPVASAQTAWTRTLGGGGQTQVTGLGTEEMLGAVREDIQRYR